jgi:hypothetical protein
MIFFLITPERSEYDGFCPGINDGTKICFVPRHKKAKGEVKEKTNPFISWIEKLGFAHHKFYFTLV